MSWTIARSTNEVCTEFWWVNLLQGINIIAKGDVRIILNNLKMGCKNVMQQHIQDQSNWVVSILVLLNLSVKLYP